LFFIHHLMDTLKPRSNGPLYSNTVIGTLAWVGCYIWYSVVPNVTAHPSTTSVATSYYSMWHYNFLCTVDLCSWRLWRRSMARWSVVCPSYRRTSTNCARSVTRSVATMTRVRPRSSFTSHSHARQRQTCRTFCTVLVLVLATKYVLPRKFLLDPKSV